MGKAADTRCLNRKNALQHCNVMPLCDLKMEAHHGQLPIAIESLLCPLADYSCDRLPGITGRLTVLARESLLFFLGRPLSAPPLPGQLGQLGLRVAGI